MFGMLYGGVKRKKKNTETAVETKGDATRTEARKSRNLLICSKVKRAACLKHCIIYLAGMCTFIKRIPWTTSEPEIFLSSWDVDC